MATMMAQYSGSPRASWFQIRTMAMQLQDATQKGEHQTASTPTSTSERLIAGCSQLALRISLTVRCRR